MRVVRERMLRIVRGPAGGMLAMLLLAAALSGVAAADPGAGNGADHVDPQAQSAGDDHSEVADDRPGTDERPGTEDRRTGGAVAPEQHTAADCQGMIRGLDLPDPEHATGLDNAILKIEADCEQNLAAPGLMVALEHLIANRERHAEHEAAMAEEGHGPDADHGDSAEHGPDAEHGPGAQPGPDAEHGNPDPGPGPADHPGNAGS